MPVSSRQAEGTVRQCHGKLTSPCLVLPGNGKAVGSSFTTSPVLPSPWTALTVREKDVERAHFPKQRGSQAVRGTAHGGPAAPQEAPARAERTLACLPTLLQFSSHAPHGDTTAQQYLLWELVLQFRRDFTVFGFHVTYQSVSQAEKPRNKDRRLSSLPYNARTPSGVVTVYKCSWRP